MNTIQFSRALRAALIGVAITGAATNAFADIKNSSDLRQGSPALAAEFLQEFAGEGPWAHADIAGPAFFERSRGDYLHQRGGTGYGVRLIVELASRLSE